MFELQYGTSTVQSYKFEYSTSKRRGLSTVRYRSLVNLQQDKSTSTGTVFVKKMRTVRYSPGSNEYGTYEYIRRAGRTTVSKATVLLQYEHSTSSE